MPQNKIVIIGAGPAGMGCAYVLSKAGTAFAVIERESTEGGMCRTINFYDYLFDIGGHRFLTNIQEIDDIWRNAMKNDFLLVNRLSRIYYHGRYFNYPLTFMNTFTNLGFLESSYCVLSYLRGKIFNPWNDETFEGWISNRFGKRLYNIFFKTYTEKVWALACKKLSADWAAHRMKGLSLRKAIISMLPGKKTGFSKTYYDKFSYPIKGPGLLYGRLKNMISESGNEFRFNKELISVRHDETKITSIILSDRKTGNCEEVAVSDLFSSVPLTVFVKMLNPQPPKYVLDTVERLNFRSLLTVNIILNKDHIFPDQWIYIHSPEVRMGRIQNYKNWSPYMVPDHKKTSLGLEYFCTEGDSLWNMNEIELIDFAIKELEKLKIVSKQYLITGFVIRQPYAYPVYFLDYQKSLCIVNDYLRRFCNLKLIGRSALYRYDNSDIAMKSGVDAAKSFLENKRPVNS